MLTNNNVSNSRAFETLSRIPLSTFSYGALCSLAFLYQFLVNPDLFRYTLNAQCILMHREYHRIITCAFFHGSFLHLAMNMFSYMALGKSLEKRFGTLFMYFTVTWSILLTSFLHVLLSLAGSIVTRDSSLLNRHSLGFSAVLFHLLVLESKCHDPDASHSILGIIHVPSKYYPWALLIMLQILIPNVSFLGHLSGILCGTLQSSNNGFYQKYLLPSIDFIHRCEQQSHPLARRITSLQSYIHAPSFSLENNDRILMFFSNNNAHDTTTILSRCLAIATTNIYTCMYNAYRKVQCTIMPSQENNNRDNDDLHNGTISMQQQQEPFLSKESDMV